MAVNLYFHPQIPIPSHCRALDQSYLTTPEKYWIVEHAEKNPDLAAIELAGNFTAKFGRPKTVDTILEILQRKEEIRHEFVYWAEICEFELNEAALITQERAGTVSIVKNSHTQFKTFFSHGSEPYQG